MFSFRKDVTIATNIVPRKARMVRAHYFEQIEGEGAPCRIALAGEKIIAGRDENAGIRLRSNRASRQHAFIQKKGDEFVIQDNDSRNGVFLNGLKIYSAVLRDGDVVQLADSIFIFQEG